VMHDCGPVLKLLGVLSSSRLEKWAKFQLKSRREISTGWKWKW
jgi:hypothetical protein